MGDRSFLEWWRTGIVLAAGVIAAVAALLVTIIVTARSILHTAERAIAVANEIVENTRPIWALDTTNRVVAEIKDGAESIARHAGEIADALDVPRPAAG